MKKYWKFILVAGIVLFGIGIYLISKGSYSVEVTNENLETLNETIAIECGNSSRLTKNTSVDCTIKGRGFSRYVSSISADLVLGDGLILDDITYDTARWQGAVTDGDIDLYTASNKIGDFVIAEFTIVSNGEKIGDNIPVSLENIIISDENFDEYAINSVSTNVRVVSDDANLSSLTVSGIDFEFSKDVTEYNLSSLEESVTINAVAANSKATVSGTGVKSINTGINTFKVAVTAEDGTTKTYTIIITKSDLSVNFTDDVVVNANKKQLNIISKSLNVNTLLEKINTEATVVIVDSLGNVKTATDLVGTDYSVQIYAGSNMIDQYTVILKGDVDGNGRVTVDDATALFNHYKGMSTIEKDTYLIAGDVKANTSSSSQVVISLADVAKLYQYVNDKIGYEDFAKDNTVE